MHALLNGFGAGSLIAGLVIIEVNKFSHDIPHFESPHSILGFITYIFIIIQAVAGIAQYYFPSVFGGVESAKKLYKYHRASGYVVLTLSLATVAAATQTTFNKSTLHIKLWAIIVAAVLVLVGVLPRIKKQKLGL